jgi:AAA-like domain
MLDDGPVPLGSPFYIERDADRQILVYLTEPGATVTVKGHAKSGKTSLLARIGAWARKVGRDSCIVDFHGLDASSLREPAALLREIAQTLADRLNFDFDSSDWSALRPHKANLSRFVEQRVLARSDRPVLFLFDGADLTFPYRAACEDLFSTLRAWHNQRANDLDNRGWSRLGLVVAHATDPALWIRDLNLSPFNVGLRIVLDDFDAAEVTMLNERYRRPLDSTQQVERLMMLVGGHPYLLRIAFDTLANRPCTLTELEDIAIREDGPFSPHLRALLQAVLENPTLRTALRDILIRGNCDDELLFQRLWKVGLIRGESRDHVEFRAKLFKDYFQRKRL